MASGISNVTQTATGRKGFGMDEYTFQVTGIDVVLTPATYWLSVAPMGDQSAYVLSTAITLIKSPINRHVNCAAIR